MRTEAIERVRYVQKVALDARLFTSNKQPLSIYLLMKCAWREAGTALSFEAASWRRRFHWTARHRRQLEHLENLEPTHRHHRIIIIIIIRKISLDETLSAPQRLRLKHLPRRLNNRQKLMILMIITIVIITIVMIMKIIIIIIVRKYSGRMLVQPHSSHSLHTWSSDTQSSS